MNRLKMTRLALRTESVNPAYSSSPGAGGPKREYEPWRIRTSETAAVGARYRIGAYRFWHRHTAILLGATPDPEYTAHALLAALAAEHVAALLPEVGEERIRAGLIRLARSAMQPPSP